MSAVDTQGPAASESYLTSLRSVWRSWFTLSNALSPLPSTSQRLSTAIPKRLEAELRLLDTENLLAKLRETSEANIIWALLLELQRRGQSHLLKDHHLSSILRDLLPSELRVRSKGATEQHAEEQWRRYAHLLEMKASRGMKPSAKDCLAMLNCFALMNYLPGVIRVWGIVRKEGLVQEMGNAKKEHAYVVMMKTLAKWQAKQSVLKRDEEGDMVPQAAELMREMAEMELHSETAMSWGLRVVKEAGRPKSFLAVVKQKYDLDLNLPDARDHDEIELERTEQPQTRPYTITRHVFNTILLALLQRNELSLMLATFETCARIPYTPSMKRHPSPLNEIQKKLATHWNHKLDAAAKRAKKGVAHAPKYNLDVFNSQSFSLLARAASTDGARTVLAHYITQNFTIARLCNKRLECDIKHLVEWNEPLINARMAQVSVTPRILWYLNKALETDTEMMQTFIPQLRRHLNQLHRHQQALSKLIPQEQQDKIASKEATAQPNEFQLSIHLRTTARSVAACEHVLALIEKKLAGQLQSRSRRLLVAKRRVIEARQAKEERISGATPVTLGERLQRLQDRVAAQRADEQRVQEQVIDVRVA